MCLILRTIFGCVYLTFLISIYVPNVESGFIRMNETSTGKVPKKWNIGIDLSTENEIGREKNSIDVQFDSVGPMHRWNYTSGRFINPLNPFDIFGNPFCNDQGFDGQCFELIRCMALAGRVGRICKGFRGVCCRFIRECGQRTSQELVYWSNYDMKEVYFRLLDGKSFPQRSNKMEGRKNFANTASTCDFRVIKRSSDFCGVRLEPHIRSGASIGSGASSSDSAPADDDGGCVDTKLTVLGLGDRLELGLCAARDAFDIKRYDIDITNIEEIKIILTEVARAESPVEVRITQLRCNEFSGEDLAGTSTGTSGIISTETPISVTSDEEEPGPDITFAPTVTLGTPKPSPPAPPVTPKPTPIVAPLPNFAACGIKGRGSREGDTELLEDEDSDKYHHKQKIYPLGPPRSRQDLSTETIKWNVPRNNESIFSYFMGAPSLLATRITFGTIVNKKEFPWQAAMFSGRGTFSCGASIIGDFFILTAAHCVTSQVSNPRAVKFRLGDWDLKSSSDVVHQEVTTSRITVHPDYSSTNLQNDIAVVKVDRRIQFSDSVRPVCLPSTDDEFSGKLATVTGWGRDQSGKLVSKLHKLEASIMDNVTCRQRWGENLIKDTMICMDSQRGDSCNGDSGGPSVIEHPEGSGKYTQIGIVSFGSSTCTDKVLPGVYTRVTKFRDWIRRQMV